MSAQERITAQLQANIDETARRAAETERLEIERAEQRTSVGGILAREVSELYDRVDQINLRTRNWRKPADFIMQKLTGRPIARTTTHWYVDVRGYHQRVYKLKGVVDGSAISIPYGESEVTVDGSFQHSWIVDLHHQGGKRPHELGVRIYDTVTEELSGLSERDLRYAVVTDICRTGYDSAVTSFTDGEADDPLLTAGNNGAEQVLAVIRQARSVIEQQL